MAREKFNLIKSRDIFAEASPTIIRKTNTHQRQKSTGTRNLQESLIDLKKDLVTMFKAECDEQESGGILRKTNRIPERDVQTAVFPVSDHGSSTSADYSDIQQQDLHHETTPKKMHEISNPEINLDEIVRRTSVTIKAYKEKIRGLLDENFELRREIQILKGK